MVNQIFFLFALTVTSRLSFGLCSVKEELLATVERLSADPLLPNRLVEYYFKHPVRVSHTTVRWIADNKCASILKTGCQILGEKSMHKDHVSHVKLENAHPEDGTCTVLVNMTIDGQSCSCMYWYERNQIQLLCLGFGLTIRIGDPCQAFYLPKTLISVEETFDQCAEKYDLARIKERFPKWIDLATVHTDTESVLEAILANLSLIHKLAAGGKYYLGATEFIYLQLGAWIYAVEANSLLHIYSWIIHEADSAKPVGSADPVGRSWKDSIYFILDMDGNLAEVKLDRLRYKAVAGDHNELPIKELKAVSNHINAIALSILNND